MPKGEKPDAKPSVATQPRQLADSLNGATGYLWRELAKNYSNVVEKKPERLGFNMK